MKPLRIQNHSPHAARQRGQTIALVAVAMVSVLAMAALAIDLTTLYVAHGEIQRAADAAALAGAKAFVDSGVTTSPSNTVLQTLAQTMATDFATAVVSQNHVAGATAQFIGGTPRVNLTLSTSGNPNAPGNPRITVTLQRTGLPLFFARVWGGSIASVSATAIAEAFNPAYSQANTGSFIPAAPKCVKPFLVVNKSQAQATHPVFVFSATGAINTTAASFIGETLTLSSACGASPGCNPAAAPAAGQYLPMLLPDVHYYCPSCAGGGNDFEKSTACCDGVTFDYAQCGDAAALNATWDLSLNPDVPTPYAQNGLQCLIHKPQQDVLNSAFANNGLLQIQAGSYTQATYNVAPGSLISTSDSIITVPLFDLPSSWPPAGQQVTVVGFLQLFVNDVGAGSTDMSATILNVVGCGNSAAGGAAISGGGASAIPVRLIHN